MQTQSSSDSIECLEDIQFCRFINCPNRIIDKFDIKLIMTQHEGHQKAEYFDSFQGVRKSIVDQWQTGEIISAKEIESLIALRIEALSINFAEQVKQLQTTYFEFTERIFWKRYRIIRTVVNGNLPRFIEKQEMIPSLYEIHQYNASLETFKQLVQKTFDDMDNWVSSIFSSVEEVTQQVKSLQELNQYTSFCDKHDMQMQELCQFEKCKHMIKQVSIQLDLAKDENRRLQSECAEQRKLIPSTYRRY